MTFDSGDQSRLRSGADRMASCRASRLRAGGGRLAQGTVTFQPSISVEAPQVMFWPAVAKQGDRATASVQWTLRHEGP
jgi:hypothetical protein